MAHLSDGDAMRPGTDAHEGKNMTPCSDTLQIRKDVAAILLGDQQPYDYQLRVANRLLQGKNVVLQAPTGAGKTKAALLPFLYARQQGIPFADRLIYAVPMRTLVTALHDETELLLETSGLNDFSISIQMGSQPDDPFFEADIVFTTIDQILSAYIGSPVSLPGRNANIVGAATIGAYLVFDEFHLLEPERALSTAVDLAARLSKFSRVLLMSATITREARQLICWRAKAEYEELKDGELQNMPSQSTKNRRMHFVAEQLTANSVLAKPVERCIVVVNTVDRAQQIFLTLRDQLPPHKRSSLRLLHSRYLPEHRRTIEEWTLRIFAKGSREAGILVATQAIEVGLNISAQVLHTELAPAAAIFQRAGRCARFEHEHGDVYVYALPATDKGEPTVAPYEADARAPIALTAEQLAVRSGQRFTFADERAVTEAAYGKYDIEALQRMNPHGRKREVENAMLTADPAASRHLIRDADSVSLAIHCDPGQLPQPGRLVSFPVSRHTFRQFANKLIDERRPLWAMATLESSEDGPPLFGWQLVDDRKRLDGVLWACAPPDHAAYDSQVGLQLGRPGSWESAVEPTSPRRLSSRSKLEGYDKHVQRTLGQFDAQYPAYVVAAGRFATELGVGVDDLTALVRLTVALHDTAKLSEGWQEAAWRWQMAVTPGAVRTGFVAHTDQDPSDRRQRTLKQTGRYRFPPHAAEASFAALPILDIATRELVAEGGLEDVQCALVSAIARHHGGEMRALDDFAISDGARSAAAARLDWPSPKFQDHPNGSLRTSFPTWNVNPTKQPLGFLLYWYVSRRLRRADQLATAEGAR